LLAKSLKTGRPVNGLADPSGHHFAAEGFRVPLVNAGERDVRSGFCRSRSRSMLSPICPNPPIHSGHYPQRSRQLGLATPRLRRGG
jgi:hypothetical protein